MRKKASGYSRLVRILKGMVPSIHSFGIISAENPQGQPLTTEENNKLIGRMKEILKASHRGYIQHKGVYGGFEKPFFIMNISKSDLVRLGEIFDQEAVIFGSVDAPNKTVVFEFVQNGTVEDVRKTVCLNIDADDFYSEYKGRNFRIPFFDEEAVSEVVDSNLKHPVPSLMPEEVEDPENEPHLATIYAHNANLKRYVTGNRVGIGNIATLGQVLKALNSLK